MDNRDTEELGSIKSGGFGFQLLLSTLGAVLVIAGYVIPSDHLLHELYIDEIFKILGTLLVGLGFTGFYEVATMNRADRNLRQLLASHLESYPRVTRQLFLDHIESSDSNLEVPDKYRTTLYLYHQTGAKIEGEEGTIWVKERYDFSRELTKRLIFTRSEMKDPRPGMPSQIYAVQLILQRGKILISMINETDSSEPVCLHILDIPVLSELSFGISHHMDWQGNGRLSRAIFCFVDPELDVNSDTAKLDELWERGSAAKYRVTLDEKTSSNPTPLHDAVAE